MYAEVNVAIYMNSIFSELVNCRTSHTLLHKSLGDRNDYSVLVIDTILCASRMFMLIISFTKYIHSFKHHLL